MFLRHNLIGILWAALVAALCFTPGKELPGAPFFSFDKLVHGLVFMVLVFQWLVGFRKQHRFHFLRFQSVPIAMTLALVYGAALENFQGAFFPDRSADIQDWLADAAGVLAGTLIYFLIFGRNAGLRQAQQDSFNS